jgi:hypothetical protein
MRRNVFHRIRLCLGLVGLMVLSLLPGGISMSQDIVPLDPGTSALGTIPADGSLVTFFFDGNLGDLVTARAVGITSGMDPNLALFGSAQQQLTLNDNEPFLPLSTAAQIVYRLQETGPYYILVGGTPGQFLLTLDVRPAATVTLLQLDTPATITLPLVETETTQTFIFNTDPFFATTLLLDATPINLDAYVELRNGTGEVVSTLRGNLNNACISVGLGDQLLELTVIALPDVTGTVTLTLSNASCVLGANQPLPTPQFTPVVVENVCAASSSRNVNIRSGPGTNYAVLALLPAGQPIQVTGQAQNGQWFVVQNESIQGWVAASVVGVTGPCAQLPIVAAPPLPVASPTPGFPVFVVVPSVITATLGPTFTPGIVVITATPVVQPPTSTVAPPPTLTATPIPPTPVPPTVTPMPPATTTPSA